MIPTFVRRCWLSSSDDNDARSLPSMRRAPEVGRSRPAIKFNNVDLPEPDVPSSARSSPSATVDFKLDELIRQAAQPYEESSRSLHAPRANGRHGRSVQVHRASALP